MKTAYELAMERLNKTAPVAKMTDEQKKQLAEMDSLYAAKIAERELAAKEAFEKAVDAGDYEAAQKAQENFKFMRNSLEAERDEKKEQVRQAKA